MTTPATASIISAAISASLWAPPTTWTSTSGLSATSATAKRGSTPRTAARRATIQAIAATESPAAAFSSQTAAPTLSLPSGAVSRVKSGRRR